MSCFTIDNGKLLPLFLFACYYWELLGRSENDGKCHNCNTINILKAESLKVGRLCYNHLPVYQIKVRFFQISNQKLHKF